MTDIKTLTNTVIHYRTALEAADKALREHKAGHVGETFEKLRGALSRGLNGKVEDYSRPLSELLAEDEA